MPRLLPLALRAASSRSLPPRFRRGLLLRLLTSELPRRLLSPPPAPPAGASAGAGPLTPSGLRTRWVYSRRGSCHASPSHDTHAAPGHSYLCTPGGARATPSLHSQNCEYMAATNTTRIREAMFTGHILMTSTYLPTEIQNNGDSLSSLNLGGTTEFRI